LYDLGDIVPLSITTRDSAGNLANATTVKLSITGPDGSLAVDAVTVSPSSTGVYEYDFPTTMTGRYRNVRWVATGALTSAYADTFYVLGADPGLIISLAEARASLRFPAGQSIDDEDLRDLVAACTPVMEDLCGPIVPSAVEEWRDGGVSELWLFKAPLIEVSTVTEYFTTNGRVLTEQPLGGPTSNGLGYTVDLRTGRLTRGISWFGPPFAAGSRNIHIEYVAGRADVPANLIRATRRLVRFMWQQEMQGQRQNGSVPEAVGTTPLGYLVPNAVKAMCAAELRVPSFA